MAGADHQKQGKDDDEREELEALKSAGASKLINGRHGLRINGWEIESINKSILTSLQYQQWEEKLKTSHLPEMVFGESNLVILHLGSGIKIHFNTFDALAGWKKEGLPPVEVPAAAKWKFRSLLLKLTHITDNTLYSTSCPPRSKVLSITRQGRGRPRKNTTPDDGDIHQSSDDQSSSQEEIIALFKRIQTSIAKEGGSTAIKKRRSDSQKDRKAAENVLDVLRQPRNKNKDDKVISKRKELKIKEELEDVSAAPEVNFTRPPSNFVKKSPIPKLSTLRSEIVEIPSENIETGIEKMKVSELKELAKSRGIKGFLVNTRCKSLIVLTCKKILQQMTCNIP